MTEATAARPVPGAPPVAQFTKNQKRRRKAKGPGEQSNVDTPLVDSVAHSTAVSERGGDVNGTREDTPAPDAGTHAESESTPQPEQDPPVKLSPIVELIQKRLKATTKKITRITTYAATDIEKLNDDQRRTLKTLPTLEAIQKELSEVKKAVEHHEATLVHEFSTKRQVATQAEKARIAEAISSAESDLLSKFSDVLTLARFRNALSSGVAHGQSLDSQEGLAVIQAADVLLGENADAKHELLQTFVHGGEFENVSFPRLIEIAQQTLNPPVTTVNGTDRHEIEAAVIGVPPAISVSSSFRFVQASELEDAPVSDWADQTNADAQPEEPETEPELEPELVEEVDEQQPEEFAEDEHPADVEPPTTTNALDWANDEEGGLPSIAGLQASFGGSEAPAGNSPAAAVNEANGDVAKEEVDGFVIQGQRHRGRGGRGGGGGGGGGGGFRGRGYRGENRGYRGERGERGEHRERRPYRERNEGEGGGEGGEHRERRPPRENHQRPHFNNSGEGGEGGERPERRPRGEYHQRHEGEGGEGGERHERRPRGEHHQRREGEGAEGGERPERRPRGEYHQRHEGEGGEGGERHERRPRGGYHQRREGEGVEGGERPERRPRGEYHQRHESSGAEGGERPERRPYLPRNEGEGGERRDGGRGRGRGGYRGENRNGGGGENGGWRGEGEYRPRGRGRGRGGDRGGAPPFTQPAAA